VDDSRSSLLLSFERLTGGTSKHRTTDRRRIRFSWVQIRERDGATRPRETSHGARILTGTAHRCARLIDHGTDEHYLVPARPADESTTRFSLLARTGVPGRLYRRIPDPPLRHDDEFAPGARRSRRRRARWVMHKPSNRPAEPTVPSLSRGPCQEGAGTLSETCSDRTYFTRAHSGESSTEKSLKSLISGPVCEQSQHQSTARSSVPNRSVRAQSL